MSFLDRLLGWKNNDRSDNEESPPQEPVEEDVSLQNEEIVESLLESALIVARNQECRPGDTVELHLVKFIPHGDVELGLQMNAHDYGLLVIPTDNTLSVRLQLLAEKHHQAEFQCV